VRATAAVLPLVIGVTILTLGAFPVAALVDKLDIGWPWWVVASVVAVVALRLFWQLFPLWLWVLNLATAFAFAALVNELDIGWPWWAAASVVAVVAAGLSWGIFFLKRRWRIEER